MTRSASLGYGGVANPNSLPSYTCMPKTYIAILLVYLFTLFLNYKVRGTI